jgi:hypothetical protein
VLAIFGQSIWITSRLPGGALPRIMPKEQKVDRHAALFRSFLGQLGSSPGPPVNLVDDPALARYEFNPSFIHRQ